MIEQSQQLGTLLDILKKVDGAMAEALIDGKTVRVQFYRSESIGNFYRWYDLYAPHTLSIEDLHIEYEEDFEDMKANIEDAFGKNNAVENPLLVDQPIWRLVTQCEACGKEYKREEGYYVEDEYSYCANCCHW